MLRRSDPMMISVCTEDASFMKRTDVNLDSDEDDFIRSLSINEDLGDLDLLPDFYLLGVDSETNRLQQSEMDRYENIDDIQIEPIQAETVQDSLGDVSENNDVVCTSDVCDDSELRRQDDSHSNRLEFNCLICSKSLSNKQELKIHLLVHFSTKPYKCVVCHKRFAKKEYLRKHMTNVTRCMEGGQPAEYVRNHCARTYYERPAAPREDARRAPNTCRVCGRTFKRAKVLQNHMALHSDSNSLRCSFCGKKFIRKKTFEAHIRRHAAPSAHRCSRCAREFHCARALRRHARRPCARRCYTCVTCDQSFCAYADLQRHIIAHTNQQLPCSTCGLRFYDEQGLAQHRLLHAHARGR